MISFAQYSCTLNSFLGRVETTDNKEKILDIDEGLSRIIHHLHTIKSANKKVMIIGNGGSAAIASHFQNDQCKAAHIRGMVFTEPPLLTALSNDISYTAAYRELVTLWADKEDMLFSISSSGHSQNIIDAVNAARARGCNPVITVSEFLPDNLPQGMGDINLYITSSKYGSVELAHSVITHFISDQISKQI